MKPFDVYPLQSVTPVKAEGCYVWDKDGTRYLDLYGGHAVISIGHAHPEYTNAIAQQAATMGFYSNSVHNPVQEEFAKRLGEVSGYPDYQLFLVNSGAEAIENALKLASFHTGKKHIISIKKGFHGRTSLAVAVTDNPKISAPVNRVHPTSFVEMEDISALETVLKTKDVAAVVIEGIQGIAGIYEPSVEFLQSTEKLCKKYDALLVLDEIQSGYGRTGKFFAHQYAGIRPDLITVAKGMGNGFPIGGVLIHPSIKPSFGLLGTTFGGTHLGCAAGLSVINVLESEHLMDNASSTGSFLIKELKKLAIKEVRGRGLMIGIEFGFSIKELRKILLEEFHVFTGTSSNPNTLRILPPLSLSIEQATYFVDSLKSSIQKLKENETVSVHK
ncbi:MAG: aminotransferase class III-fold pyridoxal phosphate-dependent enzyme [Cyclobacteriaceae bacterium]|nr:aminotransferase class III-fold pyridoxal phosphate-dependent enzyme [Cyclobacteriaceae bacterium]